MAVDTFTLGNDTIITSSHGRMIIHWIKHTNISKLMNNVRVWWRTRWFQSTSPPNTNQFQRKSLADATSSVNPTSQGQIGPTCHLIEGSEKDIHNITSTLVLPNTQTLINPNCGTFYKSGLFRSQVSRLQRSRTGWGMSQTGRDQMQHVILNWILLCKGHPWDRQWKCPGWDLMVIMLSILISWCWWW